MNDKELLTKIKDLIYDTDMGDTEKVIEIQELFEWKERSEEP